MRSLQDLLRHYNVVNDRGRPAHALRFGALLLLAFAGAGLIFLTSGTGPDRTQSDGLAASDATADSDEGRGPGAGGITVERQGDGWYLGYPAWTDAAAVDQVALEEALLDWLDQNPGHAPDAVRHDGTLYGYQLRPVS